MIVMLPKASDLVVRLPANRVEFARYGGSGRVPGGYVYEASHARCSKTWTVRIHGGKYGDVIVAWEITTLSMVS